MSHKHQAILKKNTIVIEEKNVLFFIYRDGVKSGKINSRLARAQKCRREKAGYASGRRNYIFQPSFLVCKNMLFDRIEYIGANVGKHFVCAKQCASGFV